MNYSTIRIDGNVIVGKGVSVKGNINVGKGICVKGNVRIASRISSEEYEGEYNVIPKFVLQLLETKNLLMKDNVTVEEISVFKTENIGGGYTVVIGGN